MKSRFRISLAIFMIALLVASSVVAQSGNSSANVDDLREKIKRMEAMDVSTMAPSTLEIYERTLLRLYERTLTPLQQQIDVLSKIQSSADSNDTEAAKARDKLAKEKAQIIDKISILRVSLGLGEDRSSATESAGADSDAGSLPQPAKSASNASLTASPSPTPAASPSPTKATCDPKKFPPILTDEVYRLAKSILINEGSLKEKAQEISSQNYKLVFYTVADALNVQVTVPLTEDPAKTKTISLGELEPYRYLGETVRTDKQLGSSASAASVSAVDKPGFAWLLGFGIENGLVEKNVRDSILTLSTSPAALFMLNKGNNGNAYQNAGVLNRFGVSASFNIAKQDQLLGSATRSQLREYSIKYRFAGDRSPRSKKLEAIWDGVAKDIQARLIALNNAALFISTEPVLGPLAARVNIELQSAAVSLMAGDDFKRNLNADGTFSDKNVCQLSDTMLDYLRNNVSSQVSKLSPSAVNQFKEILVPNLVAAQLNLKVVREAFNKKLDEFFKGPLGTVAYIDHREPVMGNYSEFKLLFEQNTPMLRPLPLKTITANAAVSFYHQPNAVLKQQRMRAVNVALSFEGNAASPFTETLDLGRITYSFVGSYERMFENRRVKGRKADIGSLQFLMGFPLFKGMAVPFSVSYSNATETDRRRGWRLNFGLKMDTDKLLELVRANSPR
jgi:hypothetical protein